MRPVSRRHSRRGLVGGSTFRRTPISRSPLDKNPMPGHLSEHPPVNAVNTKGQFFRASFGKNPRFQIQLDTVASLMVELRASRTMLRLTGAPSSVDLVSQKSQIRPTMVPAFGRTIPFCSILAGFACGISGAGVVAGWVASDISKLLCGCDGSLAVDP